MDGRMCDYMDGWMDGCMEGCMDVWINELCSVQYNV